MDFKKLAQDKLDKISGFKSNTDDSELDNLLDGLDLEIESVRKIDENQIELDLDINDEPVSKPNHQSVQNLFDGYIGEKNYTPNPYEYGPNATYRNLNEGVVYKKNSENLWEAFVKDGKQGIQGPRGFAAGGGTGVEEVQRIATEIVNNNTIYSEPWAIAGDSISYTAGSTAEVALNILGIPYSDKLFAVPGQRIDEQLIKLPIIASYGIKNVICQIGTNDIIQFKTLSQIYDSYRNYMRTAKNLGIKLHMIYISPMGQQYTDKPWLANVAMYRSAREFGMNTYEIWNDYVNITGSWTTSSDTVGNDNIHPVLSRRINAGTKLAEKLKNSSNDIPFPRCIHDGIHPNPILSGAGPVASAWGAYLSPASVTRSVSSYKPNGQQWQIISLNNPLNGDAAGINYYGSKAAMGFNDGDRMAVMFNANMIQNVDETLYDRTGDILLRVQFTGGGNLFLSSDVRLAYGERQIWWEYTVPNNATVADMSIYIRNRTYNTTGTITLGIRNINVINLTQNGLI